MNATTFSAAEISRLGKLAEYQVLDSAPEREFDEIVQVAAKLLGMPISVVSLIDRDRQWFKARYGISGTETPREHAFCDHAIKSDDVYVVTDATQNPLFSANPLVTGAPDIRFYAGAPLITPDNFRLGTLCVIDTKPHAALSEDAEQILTLLARMVVNTLEVRRQTMRSQHQVRMMTRLAEATVAVAQARTIADLGRVLTENARGLVVADAAQLSVTPRSGGAPRVSVATRSGDAAPPVAWAARGEHLAARKSLAMVTLKEIPAATAGDAFKGAWMGVPIGLDAAAPVGHFQVWRQSTTSFTETETAMVTDLSRVASAVAERLA